MSVQKVKNLPAMRETWVRSLGWDDPLEWGTATHSSILAWRIPWTEEAGGLQSMGSQSMQAEYKGVYTQPQKNLCLDVHSNIIHKSHKVQTTLIAIN